VADRVKRPAFQWYPGDFRRDLGVQACSWEARALWRDMLDLMHDGEPYGHLTAGGVPINTPDLARLIGKKAPFVKKLLAELESRKVFSRTAAGVIYSRRMVRDEDVRNKRATGGGRSLENENVPRPKDTKKDGHKDTSPPSLPPSLPGSNGGSPAVAFAVASASAKEPQSIIGDERSRLMGRLAADADRSAVGELLKRAPVPIAWIAELNAALDSMAGHHAVDPAQLGEAVRDYIANGHAREPNMKHFRAYLRRMSQQSTENGAVGTNGKKSWQDEFLEEAAARGLK
jgi:hypothetical protein